ncbi:hypothetical protein [Nocardia paucivorans]|uniref:hypothetical protein n=1 Tax=Nocardia paucivorans TaxID=114259 RepID=UPI000312BAF5|nr:hypothetical protein [Nocardia paucivorans]
MTNPVPQPPFPPELLSDLHSGNIDPELGSQLWPEVRRDPDAVRYLRSLDELRDELADLGRSEQIVHPMPADIAARLTDFVEALEPLDSPTSVTPLTPDSGEPLASQTISLDRYRARRALRLSVAVAATIAVIACLGFVMTIFRDQNRTPTAAPPTIEITGPADPAEPDSDDDLTAAVALRALGRHDVSGRLGEPTALTDCVRAAGLDSTVLGSTDMTFHGRDAVLILVGGREGAQITALVVGAGCSADDPQVLTITDIG